MKKETYTVHGKGYTVKISPNFTIDDIHKIREARAKVTMKMTQDERIAYYNSLEKLKVK